MVCTSRDRHVSKGCKVCPMAWDTYWQFGPQHLSQSPDSSRALWSQNHKVTFCMIKIEDIVQPAAVEAGLMDYNVPAT